MSKLIEFLSYSDLPYPYTDKDFISEAECLLEELVYGENEIVILCELLSLECKYLHFDDYFEKFGMWAITGCPIYALAAFDELDDLGVRLTPAMQKILAQAIHLYLHDEVPIDCPTDIFKLKRPQIQNEAITMAAELVVFLGDSHSKACSKASNYFKSLYPDLPGLSPDRLKKQLEKKPRWVFTYVKANYGIRRSDSAWVNSEVERLRKILDIQGSF